MSFIAVLAFPFRAWAECTEIDEILGDTSLSFAEETADEGELPDFAGDAPRELGRVRTVYAYSRTVSVGNGITAICYRPQQAGWTTHPKGGGWPQDDPSAGHEVCMVIVPAGIAAAVVTVAHLVAGPLDGVSSAWIAFGGTALGLGVAEAVCPKAPPPTPLPSPGVPISQVIGCPSTWIGGPIIDPGCGCGSGGGCSCGSAPSCGEGGGG